MQIASGSFKTLALPQPKKVPTILEQPSHHSICPKEQSSQNNHQIFKDEVETKIEAQLSKPQISQSCWQKFSKKQKVFLITMVAFLILTIITIACCLAFLRSRVSIVSERTYKVPFSSEVINIQDFKFTQPRIRGENIVTQGQFISINLAQKKRDLPPGIIKVTDKESGIILKALNLSNFIIEADVNQLLLFLDKNDPVQAKRLLAQSALDPQSPKLSSSQVENLRNELLQSAINGADMVGNAQIRLVQLYKGMETAQGYQLQRKQQKTSRLLQAFLNKRSLGFKSLFKSKVVAPIEKLARAVASLVASKPPITYITVYNISNQTNITIVRDKNESNSLIAIKNKEKCNKSQCIQQIASNSKQQVVVIIDNQQVIKKEVTIQEKAISSEIVAKGKEQKPGAKQIEKNENKSTPSSSTIKSNEKNRINSEDDQTKIIQSENINEVVVNKKKRMLQQKDLPQSSLQETISLDAFKSVTICNQFNGFKLCPIGEWMGSQKGSLRDKQGKIKVQELKGYPTYVIALQEVFDIGLQKGQQPKQGSVVPEGKVNLKNAN